MRRLSDAEWNQASSLLTGRDGSNVAWSVFDLALGNEPRGGEATLRLLAEAGWFLNGEFTELGGLIRDPLREYGFWLERKGMLPSEAVVPVLERTQFKNKRLLELGSGGGCNLFSLTGIPSQLTGVEPMPVYLQMMKLLSAMAKLPIPEVIEASAESIPLSDQSYDVVICYSSHQYMNINKALAEMARVLAPGGKLIIVGNSLYPFMSESLVNFVRSRNVGRAKFNIVSIINTLFYQLFGRRIISSSNGTTATPIYPSKGYMLKRLDVEGLKWIAEQTCELASGETVLVATKSISGKE